MTLEIYTICYGGHLRGAKARNFHHEIACNKSLHRVFIPYTSIIHVSYIFTPYTSVHLYLDILLYVALTSPAPQ